MLSLPSLMLYMNMGKQMILTILIVSLTFRTKPEFQLRVGFLRSAADRTFMPGDLYGMFHFSLKVLPSLYLLWR